MLLTLIFITLCTYVQQGYVFDHVVCLYNYIMTKKGLFGQPVRILRLEKSPVSVI